MSLMHTHCNAMPMLLQPCIGKDSCHHCLTVDTDVISIGTVCLKTLQINCHFFDKCQYELH